MQKPMPPKCCEEGLPDPTPLTDEQIARVAKALGHPVRVGILHQFDECRPHIVQEVVEGSGLAQSTISEHLRILREAELLFATHDGPRVWYCMRRSVLRKFSRAVERIASEERSAARF